MTTKQKQCADALAKVAYETLTGRIKKWAILGNALNAYEAACNEPEPVADWIPQAAQEIVNGYRIGSNGFEVVAAYKTIGEVIAKHAARPDPQAVTLEKGDLDALLVTLAFYRSVINCGEPWTDECEKQYIEAREILAERAKGAK